MLSFKLRRKVNELEEKVDDLEGKVKNLIKMVGQQQIVIKTLRSVTKETNEGLLQVNENMENYFTVVNEKIGNEDG